MTGPQFASAAAPPDLNTIVNGIARSKRLFFEDPRSFRIVSAVERVVAFAPEGQWTRSEVTAARMGDKWFTQERLRDPTPKRGEDKRVYASKDKKALDWQAINSSCVLSPSSVNPNVCANWRYVQTMGLSVYRYIAHSHGVSYEDFRMLVHDGPPFDHPFLPEYIEEHRKDYRILPEPENVDGFRCWVVEWPGMDRFCIDLDHGFAVRQRSYHWGPGKPLRYNISQKDFREVRKGLWLPFVQIVEQCGRFPTGKKEWWGKPINRVEYALKAIDFDTLGDDFFDIRLPPGTRVLDRIENKKYTVAVEGTDPFAGAIANAEQVLRQKQSHRGLFIAVFLLAICIFLLIVRRMRRRRGEAHA